MKKLFFFTNTYPYNIGEQWKTNELLVLRESFEITVIPFFSNSNILATELINGVSYQSPLFDSLPYISVKKRLFLILLSKLFFVFLTELISKNAYKNKTKFIQWISASHKILLLYKNKKLRSHLKHLDDNTILYFFWGKESSEILPVLKLIKKANVVVRFHGYDLYEERNNNYIPYRKQQLKKISEALFVSEHGKNYMLNKYKNIKFSATVSRLGTTEEGKSKISEDNILRIFSCSSIITLKRVEMIANAIYMLKFPVIWTHIGGGEKFEEIKRLSKNAPKNIKIILTGKIRSNLVKNYYVNKFADLFINVSTTEGVPISIMEAMSAEIPIFATNVGGTSELVNNNIGCLLPQNLSANLLSEEITKFYNLTYEQKKALRINSYLRFKKISDAKKLAKNLSSFLQNLI